MRVRIDQRNGIHRLSGIGALILTLVLSGCLNQMQPRSGSKRSISSQSVTFAGTTESQSKVIYKAVRTESVGSSDRNIDLIGAASFAQPAVSDGFNYKSSALGNFCMGGQTDEKLPCQCKYRYEAPCTAGNACNGSQKIIRDYTTEAVYFELNLVRCPFPMDYQSGDIQISVVRPDRNAQTNIVTVNPAPLVVYDDPRTYRPVQRYTCRYAPFIPHMMAGQGMIDTIQADSPLSTSRRIYYTTNMGRALASMVAGGAADRTFSFYECPPHVSEAKASREIRLSVDGGRTTSEILSDAKGKAVGQDRVNFFLAQTPVGPLNYGLKSISAPFASFMDMGYAALPDSSSQRCVSVPPNGFEWKKLWIFKSNDRIKRQELRILPTNGQKENYGFHIACDPQRFTKTGQTSSVNGASFFANQYNLFGDCGKHISQANRNAAFNTTDGGDLRDGLECNDARGTDRAVANNSVRTLTVTLSSQTDASGVTKAIITLPTGSANADIVGMLAEGSGVLANSIPSGTYVEKVEGTRVTLSQAPNFTGTGPVNFFMLSRILMPHEDLSQNNEQKYYKCVSMSGVGNWRDSCSVSKFSCDKVNLKTALVGDYFGLCKPGANSNNLTIERNLPGMDHETRMFTNASQYLFYVGDNDSTNVLTSNMQLFVPAGNSTVGGEWFSPQDSFQGVTFPLCVLQRRAGQ
ncbi:MAG: hypothetical protein KGQ59_09845 [Bdellovibrionales bacterium]|nr:hypothetical protein [Bdellovibrionales bacterium]